ncbi:MAG: ATP-binding cassette domain-containing protein, partial [Bacteroidales bacterium]|nr:ATP-binding cassette domain-containing protein [Bacteroidales bacterium]
MLIKLTDISAAYNKDIVLSKVNLTVNKGDFVGIIGPNGGGKTTLLKIILGLIKPVSGRIEYAENLNIGYLP